MPLGRSACARPLPAVADVHDKDVKPIYSARGRQYDVLPCVERTPTICVQDGDGLHSVNIHAVNFTATPCVRNVSCLHCGKVSASGCPDRFRGVGADDKVYMPYANREYS